LKGNIHLLKAGISLGDLPQTFRDAIEVARRLNIPYIWIDSLCIIQDSIEDWNKEASLMSGVYGHAICNIAATGALDSTKGLFFEKDLHAIRPCKVQVPVRQSTKVKIVYIIDPNYWRLRLDNSPLLQRAWVVQERLLARRVLHFNRDQLYWECRERSACEIFPFQMPKITMWLGSFKDIVPTTEIDEEVSKRLTNPWISRENIWAKVVMSYSRAQLSNQGDKEAALSGILRTLEGIFDDTCTAGMWRKGLPSQLIWQTCTLCQT
jgi:Heterokaryon incompatibility protein (HET)